MQVLPRFQLKARRMINFLHLRFGSENWNCARSLEHQDHRCAARRDEEGAQASGRQGREHNPSERPRELRAALRGEAVRPPSPQVIVVAYVMPDSTLPRRCSPRLRPSSAPQPTS